MTRRRFLTTLSIAGVGSVLGVEGPVLGSHRLTITRHHVRSPRAASGPRLRIAQLADTRLRGLGVYQERIAAEVNALGADVVVLTGDSIDQQKRLSVLGTFLGWLESPVRLGALPEIAVFDWTVA